MGNNLLLNDLEDRENIKTNDNTSEVILSLCNKYMHKTDRIKVKSEIKLKPLRMCKKIRWLFERIKKKLTNL